MCGISNVKMEVRVVPRTTSLGKNTVNKPQLSCAKTSRIRNIQSSPYCFLAHVDF